MSKKQQKNDSIDNIIENTFNHIKDIVDANTVVGDIIELGKSMYIIPVSKISVGLISGGGSVPKTKNNISAGSGTGFNVIPIGFITIKNSVFDFLPVNIPSDISKSVIDGMFKIYEGIMESKNPKEQEIDEE